MHVNW